MTPKDVVQFARENECTMVDVKFQELLGPWQHHTAPVQQLGEGTFVHGFRLDGGFLRRPQGSGLRVVPDPDTARVDPIPHEKTLHLIGELRDSVTGEPCDHDPRRIARRAEAHLRRSGIGDVARFGHETEFFVFDEVRYDQTRNSGFFIVDSAEGSWNSGRDEQPNLGYKPRGGGGWRPSPPNDSLLDLRNEMVLELLKVGVEARFHRHGEETAGQGIIGVVDAPLLQQADNVQWLKHIAKNVAARNGKTLTFMPKPLFDGPGSGMRVQQALWKDRQNLFAGGEHGGVSQLALWYAGGLLRHARALSALCNPTTNSYRRLAPGGGTPADLCCSSRDDSAAVRLLPGGRDLAAAGIECRTPDGGSNGYLAFAALLMAGLDGIENRIEPGPPRDGEPGGLGPEGTPRAASLPRSLGEALDCLEADHDFLCRGDVFSRDVIAAWIDGKSRGEVDAVAARPVPWEFALYYDC